MADRRQQQRPPTVTSRAVTGVWVVVLKAGIEWEATGIQIPFFGCGLKQINSDSTFYFVCGPLPLPPSRQPIGELMPLWAAERSGARPKGVNPRKDG